MEAFWRPGDVFVDVGAHLGWYTTLASRAVGDAGKVFAFEPNRKSYELLKKNLAENKCFNVVLEHVAVSDSSGECSVYTIGDLWFGSSLIDPRKDPGFYIEPNLSDYDDRTIIESKVHKTSLDDYFGTRKINFIKTDTEGNDGKVFAGMQNILKNNPDIIIYMEFAPSLLKRFGTDPEELVQEIHRMGFNIFMSDGRTVEPFKPNPRFSGNLFITRRNVHKEIAAIG